MADKPKSVESDLNLPIGGFEKWPLLIEDCQKKVVEFLDYKTRCHLSWCSKSDHALVESTPIYARGISIVDNEEIHPDLQKDRLDCVVVRVWFVNHPTLMDYFELVFSQLKTDTLIRWPSNLPKKEPVLKSLTLPNSNYRQKAVMFFECWLKKCRYEVEELTVEMSDYPFESSHIKSLGKRLTLRVASDDLEVFKWWIEKCTGQTESLQMLSYRMEDDKLVLSPQLLSLPQVLNASSIEIWCKSGFSDEQFVSLKADRIRIHPINITDRGVNMFLKKCAGGKAEHFVKAILFSSRVPNEHEVLYGLKSRPWDENFRQENLEFCDDYDRCCGVGTCYQVLSNVEPLSSLTVGFYSDRVAIYATGKKIVQGDKEVTVYTVAV